MKFGVIFVCLFAVSIFFVSSFSITGKGVSGDVNIGVDESTRLIIHSPLNTTYNFEPNEDFLVDLNVTSMLNITGWRYSLYDFLHSSYVKTEEGFNPNTTIETVRKANKLIVQAREEGGNWITKEVIFYVNVSNAAPIINYVDDEILACEGQTLEYFFNATDSDEDALVSDITPKNPFYTSTLGTTGNVTFFKIFSSKLSKSHPGNYSETLSVSDLYGPDCCVDTKITNISVIEINNLPLMSGIGAQTVWTRGESSNFYHQMGVSDIEDGNTYDGNLRFNISFSDNENLFSIDNYYGIMNYTPSAGDIGVYSVRVCAEDNPLNGAHKNISYCLPYGNWSESACDNFTITVTDVNRNPQIIAYSPEENNFSVGSIDISSFYVRTYDPDLTIPDIDWYVGGVLKEHNEENEEDNFSYTFGCDVSGNFTIMAVATDGLANATHKWNVSVNLVACPPEQKRTGGGGGGGKYCFEKWVCDDWELCQNLKRSFDIKMISENDYYDSNEICAQEKYDEKSCGFQLRNCADLENCSNQIFRVKKPVEYQICYFTENPDCQDGIKNCHDDGCELLVDCGGPCGVCPTCSDKIQNQGEFGIDCGGPCPYSCEKEIPLLFNWMFLLLILLLILTLMFILLKLRKIRQYKKDED